MMIFLILYIFLNLQIELYLYNSCMYKNINNNLKFEDIFDNSLYTIKWRGFVFISDFKNGRDSVEHLANNECSRNILSRIHELKGHYVMQIFVKDSGLTYIFTDNAGLYTIYYDKGRISNSFIDIAETRNNLDTVNLAEFISFGKNFNNRTYTDNIRSLSYNEIIIIKKEEMTIKRKFIPFQNFDMDYIFRFMEGMEKSLSQKNKDL